VKQPSHEARILDLAKGRRDHYEEDPIIGAGKNVLVEYEWIAEQIVSGL
jgi:hypothetical protein